MYISVNRLTVFWGVEYSNIHLSSNSHPYYLHVSVVAAHTFKISLASSEALDVVKSIFWFGPD